MGALQDQIAGALYGRNPWINFRPIRAPTAVQGWNGEHPALARAIEQAPTAVAIDVGVFKGQASIFMARRLKEKDPDACLISIDTFLGEAEHWSGNHFFETRFGLPDLYATFLENIYFASVSDVVLPLPQTPAGAARVLAARQIAAGVIHLDASHDHDEVLRDAHAYWNLLAPGGFLVGDDYDETWPGVVSAARAFADATQCELSVDGPKWIVRRPE